MNKIPMLKEDENGILLPPILGVAERRRMTRRVIQIEARHFNYWIMRQYKRRKDD